MTAKINHLWNLPVDEVLELQKRLSTKIITIDNFSKIQLVAGVDVAYKPNSDKLTAAIVILNANDFSIIESSTVTLKATFPYISGLFSFREIPPLLASFEKIKNVPDLIVCDAQGYAHPRRFGLACHLGLLMDIPTIGCAKSLMIGKYVPPGGNRGDFSNIIDKGEVIGQALRTQNNVNPVYVSIGHKISLETSAEWILKLSPKYRLPETTRLSDQLSRKASL